MIELSFSNISGCQNIAKRCRRIAHLVDDMSIYSNGFLFFGKHERNNLNLDNFETYLQNENKGGLPRLRCAKILRK